MTPEERKARARKQRDMIARVNREREAAGVCRHCGGPVPCWSPFGDKAVGRRQ